MPQAIPSKLLALSLTTLLLTGCGGHRLMHTSMVPVESISVSGSGEVQAVPDRFKVRAVASREGSEINALKQAVDQEVSAVLTLARELGFDERQVRAATMSVQPQWQWEPERKLVGYRVSRDIDVTADGLEAYAHLLEGMTRIGLGEVHPAGSEIRDREAIEQQALAAAVANARARASVLAEAAGRKLGSVIAIQAQEGSQHVPVMMMEARVTSAKDSSWTPGQTDVRQQVQVQFRLD